MKNRVFILFISLISYIACFSQRLSAVTDTNKILIGEKIQLVLKAVIPKNEKPLWFTIDTIPHFEILDKSKIETQPNENNLVLTQTLTLTSWDSGKWQIPSFKLFNTTTKPITVFVAYTPFDVSKPYNDIKDIADVKKPEHETWYWYVIGAAILIVLFLLFFPAGKKQPRPVSEIDLNAYKKAMQQLEKIRSSNLAEKNVKEYYSQLVGVFRWYVQARKGIQSVSRTTDTLIIQLQQLNLPQDQYSHLLQVLRLSDFVKFAKFEPAAKENDEAFNTIKQSIIVIENSDAV